jgi:hypothetical protein
MKKLLLTTATLFALATPAIAIDLGNGWAFDNTVTLEYFVEAGKTEASYEAELKYAFNDQLYAYTATKIDLQNVNFGGLDFGVNYAPAQLKYATFNAEMRLDNELSYKDVVLTAEIRF